MRSLVRAVVMVSVIASAGPALAIPFIIDVIPRPGFPVPEDPDDYSGFGSWREDGVSGPGYLVGYLSEGTIEAPSFLEYRNFFTFNLSALTSDLEVVSAALEVRSWSHEAIPADEPVHYELFDVDTAPGRLFDFGAGDPEGSIYRDLGSGTKYGVLPVDGTMLYEGVDLVIPLNASAIADLSAHRGGLFSIGGALLERPVFLHQGGEGRFLFAFPFSGGPQRLVLEVQQVPEPATWLLLGLGLLGVGLVCRRVPG